MLAVETIRAYQALCSFCSWGFYTAPERDELAGLVAERNMFSEEPFSIVAPEASLAFRAALGSAAGEGVDGEDAADEAATGEVPAGEEALDAFSREVRLDHTYLFLMVGSSKTSPYESVYRTDDSTMFGPTTLQVRDFYKRYGLAYENAASEPDDHVGIEFAFVAHMLDVAAHALEGEKPQGAGTLADDSFASDAATAEAVLSDAAAFLSEHLLVFAPTYLSNVAVRAKSDFYRSLAGIALGVVAALADALGASAVEAIDERYTLLE